MPGRPADWPGRRAGADAALTKRIRAVQDEDNTLGAPRVAAELNHTVGASVRVNHKRVTRVMRLAGIPGYMERRVRTTVPEPADEKFPTCSSGTSPPGAELAPRG